MKKAREGVRVCMLVWDDKSSLNSSIMGGSGMMATHDEDTRKFFANTGVHIHHLLCLGCISMPGQQTQHPTSACTRETDRAKQLVNAKGMYSTMAANADKQSCSLLQCCIHCM